MMIPGTHDRTAPRSGPQTCADRLREIVATVLRISPDKARGDAALAADLGATSLDFVELVMAVEDEFDIEISDTEASRLETVDDFLALVERTRRKQDPSPGSHQA